MSVIVFASPTNIVWGGVVQLLTRSFTFSQSEGEVVDVTWFGSPVIGTDFNTRIEKSYDTVSVEPVIMSLESFGYPIYSMGAESFIGRTEILQFTTPNGLGGFLNFNSLATLKSWTWNSNRYNEPATSSVEFYLSGA